ncbi:MAG: hypothetical protein ACRYG8_06660 [Janthinobacterium lividum]
MSSSPATESPELLSIFDAAERGIERLRQTNWTNPLDHIKLDIIDGKPGPWVHLWCPFNKECNGCDPLDLLITMWGVNTRDRCLVAYTGPLPNSVEYLAEVARFEGCLS